MFKNKKSTSTDGKSTNQNTTRRSAPSVISSDMRILGNVHGDGFIDIDGHIEGNVKCQNATVRANGRVRGDVIADQVHVYGRVDGLIKSKIVTLHATAHVEGVIMHESLSIEDGAFVDGKFKRLDKVFMDDDDLPTMDTDDEPGLSAEALEIEEELLGLEKNLRLVN